MEKTVAGFSATVFLCADFYFITSQCQGSAEYENKVLVNEFKVALIKA